MFISVWVLAASASLYQPQTPMFETKQDCEQYREVYLRHRDERAGKCVNVRVLVNKL